MKHLVLIIVMACFVKNATSQTQYETHNSDCSTAEQIEVSSSPEILRFAESNTFGGGGQSSIDACGGGDASYDIWYKFVASGTEHDLITSTYSINYLVVDFEVFSGSCGSLTSLGCNDIEANFGFAQLTGLTPGNTYYVRFYYTGASSAGGYYAYVRLAVTSPLTNDDCSGAITLDAVTEEDHSDDMRMFHTFTATESQGTCGSVPSGSTDDDVWFKFTATAEKHAISVIPFALEGMNIHVLSGTCGSLSNVKCASNYYAVAEDLNVGETYYVRVFTDDSDLRIAFQIAVLLPAPNDECSNAETFEPSAVADCSRGVSFNLQRATKSLDVPSGCGSSGSAVDVWYKFQPTSSDMFLKVLGDSDADVALYSGGCSSLTCVESSTENYNVFNSLNTSDTYYLRVYSGSPSNTRFICLSPDPDNDDCSNAIEVPVTPYDGTGDPLYGNTTEKTNSQPDCTSGSTSNADVWYKFVATATGHVVYAPEFSKLEMFQGSCGSLVSLVCGGSNKPIFAKNLTIGTTYYVRVFSNSSSIEEFVLRVTTIAPNDECNTATVLTPQTSSFVDENMTYGRIYATKSMPSCTLTANYSDDDVWFKFTATDTSHGVLMKDGAFQEMFLQVFSGTCGSLNSLWCSYGLNEEYVSKTLFGLIPGQDYFIRVYSELDSTSGPQHRFSLIVTKPPVNNEMNAAIPINTFSPSGITSMATYSTHGASKSHALVCGSITIQPSHDVWFYFIAQQTAHTIKADGNNQFSPDAGIDFRIDAFSTYTTNYATLSSIDIGCATNTLALTGLTVGDTVYFRVFPFELAGVTSDFALSISNNQNADEPSGAVLLTLTNNYSHAVNTNGMTQTLPPSGCRLSDFPDDDIWFKFVAASEPQRVVCDDENKNMGLELFSGTPGSLTFVKCADNILVIPANLTVGNTYYIRAFSKATGTSVTFKTGLFDNPEILATTCIDPTCLSTNLVTNPGCEFLSPPVNYHSMNNIHYNSPPAPVTDGWYNPTRASPDCYDADLPYDNWGDAPSGEMNYGNIPRSGKGTLGILRDMNGYHEYVSTELSQPMTVGYYYYVSFYIRQRDESPISGIGALLTTDSLYYPTVEMLPFAPHFTTPPDELQTSRKQWRNVCGTVYADKPYKHMTIGLFATVGDDVLNTSELVYTLIDDVFVSEVDVACMPAAVNTPNQEKYASLNLYPNPATKSITVVSTEYGPDVQLKIFDVTGKLRLRTTQLTEIQQVDLGALANGVYIIQVTSDSKTLTQKVVIQR